MSVSVIIPNRNNAAFIAECLRSVADDPAVREIVIFDDASSDQSLAIVESLGLPMVKLIRETAQLGAHRARSEAVSQASNAVICLLDGDDRLARGSVSAGYTALVERELDIAVPSMVRFRTGQAPTPYIAALETVIDGLTAFRRTLDAWRIHPMGILKRELYLQAADRMQAHGFSDDELFARHLFLTARRVGGSPGTYEYRIVDKPKSAVDRVGQMRTRRAVIALALEAGVPAGDLGRLVNGFGRELLRALPVVGPSQRTELRALARGLPSPAIGWTLQDRLMRALIGMLELDGRH